MSFAIPRTISEISKRTLGHGRTIDADTERQPGERNDRRMVQPNHLGPEMNKSDFTEHQSINMRKKEKHPKKIEVSNSFLK
ncbi:hypothetical protein [Paraburkholderia sp. C35]|uniref:hypothetical protein n=1 Tax=Paraburkholderia sp. C35 TaxID=2126993 RepID=UPI0013A59E16|nr:hypothetical protein [Paraburkholderia sp. C35]